MKIFTNNQDSEIIIKIQPVEIIEFASAFASKVCDTDIANGDSAILEIYKSAAEKRNIFIKLYESYQKNEEEI